MNIHEYQSILSSQGRTLAAVKKNQSYQIINRTFTYDPEYKRVYMLTRNGWTFEDAKYQKHSTPSILKDAVDYYLQFRPGVHFPIGSYVIIPDETSPDINLNAHELLDPFSQPVKNRTQWWMIVGRDDANAFVRYNILKCNWNFQWIWDGEIKSCYGVVRSANSYTSGFWRDEVSYSLDDLTSVWLPDLYHAYGDQLESLGLNDNRTIHYEQRFMLGNNALEPRVYQVTKIVDLTPQGIIKLSLKQDEFNKTRDNAELRICDYYSSIGESKIELVEDSVQPENCTINWMMLNADDELVITPDSTGEKLHIGTPAYFSVNFESMKIAADWKITLIPDDTCDMEATYYENLIKMQSINDHSIILKPGKARSLLGKSFLLSVSDSEGNHYSSIIVEVAE